MSSHVFGFGRFLTVVAAVFMLLVAGSSQAKIFKFQPLSDQDAARLNEKAKEQYELGVNWVSKIDYPLALQHFTKAVEAQPDNVYLRYVVVQVAVYIGDTRKGKQSIESYDLALTQLKAIDESPQLNAREKDRVEGLIDTIGKLKDAVGARDQNRIQFGRKLAAQYAELTYKKKEETAADQGPEREALERSGVVKKQAPVTGAPVSGVDVISLYKKPRRQGSARPSYSPATPASPTDAAGTAQTGAETTAAPTN